MSVRAFIKSRIFLKQLLYAVFVVVALLWFSLKFLDLYTMHGRTITVPDFEGVHFEDAEQIIKRLNLRYVINDSIFDPAREKGTIASQDPKPNVQVKRNRTIYLTTVAKMPEMVSMPELTDLSLRQAISILESLQLNIGKLEYISDIAQNSVIRAKYNNGTIEPGTNIEKGTYIDLVLGRGSYLSHVPVPLVIGKPRTEARFIIQAASLNIGKEVFLDNERANARVFRMVPDILSRNHNLQMGSNVDIYYRSDKNFDFNEYLDEVLTVTLPYLIGRSPEDAKRVLERSFLTVGAEYFHNNVAKEMAVVYKQTPTPADNPKVLRETKVNLWYKSVDEVDLTDEIIISEEDFDEEDFD